MTLEELNIILEKTTGNYNQYNLFIETGSLMGETLGNLKGSFGKLISIEITDKYYNLCNDKFKNDENVEIVKGDCVIELPKVIKENLDNSIIFFLDGHYSAGMTGKGIIEVPLMQELKSINELYSNPTIIIIDDADLFEFKDHIINWNGINEQNLLSVLGDRVDNHFYVGNLKPKNSKKKRLIIELKSK
jgi:hypothetical protein